MIMRKETYTFEVEILEWSELGSEVQNIISKAKSNTERAYSPYSKFSVGAAALLENGKIIDGNNQENMAYPSGLCAERIAIFSAGSLFPNEPIKILAIAAQTGGSFTDEPVTPCGGCRQVLSEQEMRQKKEMDIYLYGKKKIYHIKGANKLMPLSFSF